MSDVKGRLKSSISQRNGEDDDRSLCAIRSKDPHDAMQYKAALIDETRRTRRLSLTLRNSHDDSHDARQYIRLMADAKGRGER